MHHEEIKKSILEITRAIDHLNQAFEKRAADLQKSGDAQGFQKWLTACQAMRDSGNIYLTWARYYAQSTESGGSSDEEETNFLNEGAVWDDSPPGR